MLCGYICINGEGVSEKGCYKDIEIEFT
jgi:hypothetical protein